MKQLFHSSEVYSEKYYLKQYNDSYFRIIHCYVRGKGFESINKKKSSKDEVERCSVSRSKKNIRELAFCNPFTHFVTFTVRPEFANRFDLDECQDKLRELMKAYKRKNPKLIYLFITEKHQNGAYHFHGLMGNFDKALKNDLYTNQYGYISSKHWDKLGWNSFSEIKDFNKCCNYITKYITPDCVRNSSGTIYISSRGLRKADKYEIPPVNFLKWQYENDYVQIKDSFHFTDDECKKFFQFSIDLK